jgi:hypothetical protein
MTNLTPRQVLATPAGELAARSSETLFELKNDAADRLASAKALVEHLEHALALKYAERAQALRLAAGKGTGTVRFEEDGFVVTADLPKRTEYDQRKLKAAVETLRRWGENPDHYVAIEIKVSEAKYNAWPPAIRNLFEPARTVKTGKPSYPLAPVPAKTRDRKLSEVL